MTVVTDVCPVCRHSGRDIATAGHGANCPYGAGQVKKPSNPKDTVGVLKYAVSYVPCTVIGEMALGMMEGGHKYGKHNYRAIGIRASIYFDATVRHLFAWQEGEDSDPDSKAKLNHITKAITSLAVLRDAMIQGNWVDDRPIRTEAGWDATLNGEAEQLDAQYPDKVSSYTEQGKVR